ncbi:methyl-galactoside transport system substrate-binding protein [Clostridium beijerinckii]|nr:methyl-galactoside transport system substrate-binding protein [Clostridium beijerinckii]NRY46841.1 methyl-galactoside transport system substrate-binding protein [Clostridium beijerinckii]NSA02134.1 methyl-galactoside transport system substrate-binding protein [Clostridium beijerinckii]NSA89106.1 methyl-galactoside transport system substrate-binding protein [Clostridium beijerinckii]
MLEYVVLKGQHNNIESNERTDAAISAINNAGIKTKELAVKVANWDVDLGRITADSLFLNFGNRIEAIISNNDAMAIGAIEAIQKYGFNKGDESKYIAVFGIDALPEAKELIKQGVMAGTVIQDSLNMAQAIYTIGMNVFQGNEPLYNTQYMFDDTKIAVRLLYKKYFG